MTTYRPHPDVVCREIEGEAVLLHLGTGIYFGLNAVGTRIWQLLDAAQDAPAIVDTLALRVPRRSRDDCPGRR